MGKSIKQVILVDSKRTQAIMEALEKTVALDSSCLPIKPIWAKIVGYAMHPIVIKREVVVVLTYTVRALFLGDSKTEERVISVLAHEEVHELLNIGTAIKLLVTKQGNYDVFTY